MDRREDTGLRDWSVGWIGTGRMGAPLAGRLVRSGLDVAVWNRTASKVEPLRALGAKVAGEPSDLAARDVVFTMVSSSADLKEVVNLLFTGHGGSPRFLVECSTVSVEASAWAREMAAQRGAAFLAAPVSGNGRVVRAGLLSLVCSGPREAFDELAPLLGLLGRHVSYVGEGEAARLAKICHNLMLGVVAQNLAEITVLAEKGGISRSLFLDFLNNSVMGSLFTRYKTPALVNLDFSPTFTPVLLRKDLDLGLAAGSELGVPLPLVSAARESVQAAIAQGHSSADFATLLLVQAAASGLALEPLEVEVDDGLAPQA